MVAQEGVVRAVLLVVVVLFDDSERVVVVVSDENGVAPAVETLTVRRERKERRTMVVLFVP